MRANIIYILATAIALAGCNSETETGIAYLEGSSKTPIAVQTNISTAPVTRAFDKTFEPNDELYAYIEAGKLVGETFTADAPHKWKNSFTFTGSAPLDNGGEAGVGNITTTDALSPTIYWDDFSSISYDLRATDVKRGIRLKYGYCFNGGKETNASDVDEEAGTLTWTVSSDQTLADSNGKSVNMRKSDLLFAETQDMIEYGHNEASRGVLKLPYTHAMSKVTINVIAGEGYDTSKENFSATTLTLKNMQIVANVDAPNASVTAPETPASVRSDIQTFKSDVAKTTATYQAIIAPTILSKGNTLATITDIDGNNYNIPVTSDILAAWSAESKMVESMEEIEHGVAQAKPLTTRAATIEPGKGYQTKPGIHYILTVTVNKQKITLRATITDWESVSAFGEAAINFTDDITGKGSIASVLQDGGFDVYKSSNASSFTEKSTTLEYNSGKWTYTPKIYWNGQTDNSYFRAISPAGASPTKLEVGKNLIWGTSGTAPITPRTGDVLLTFKNLMSNLSVKLVTTDDDATKVDLTNATIKITDLAKEGTYSIVNGTVASGSVTSVMLQDKENGFKEPVIPQSIGDAAKLIITLNDGTTYSLQLNQCVVTGSETTIGEWEPGKDYTYTIHLEKGKITFRAVVDEWKTATGSGNANLEWD